MQSVLGVKHGQEGGELCSCSGEALRVTLVSAVLMAFLAQCLQEAFAWSHTRSYPCIGDCILLREMRKNCHS